jgi:hypothetical protein
MVKSVLFMAPQVKFTAAKKVAGILKLSEEDAFDVGDPPPQVIRSFASCRK